ncbi:MAG: ATP-binding protein [Alphaproteobacteria bacterium]
MGLKKDFKGEIPSFSEMLANRICGKHNQHAIILFEGKTGTGKSYASLRLAYDCSLLFAKKLGGRPEDYFTLNNVGILTAEETIRIAKSIKQYGIYILDDAGAEGLSSRKWQSEQNEVMTKLLQTFRTNNNLLLLSSPDKGFIDKIARTLIHYKITMAHAFFDKGVSLGKLTTVKKIYTKDSSTNYYPFLRAHGMVFNYILFTLPPKALCEAYDRKRKRIEREMNLRAIAMLEESKKKEAAKIEKQKKKAEAEEARKINARLYKQFVESGVKAQDALKRASKATGVVLSLRTVQRDYDRFFNSSGV